MFKLFACIYIYTALNGSKQLAALKQTWLLSQDNESSFRFMLLISNRAQEYLIFWYWKVKQWHQQLKQTGHSSNAVCLKVGQSLRFSLSPPTKTFTERHSEKREENIIVYVIPDVGYWHQQYCAHINLPAQWPLKQWKHITFCTDCDGKPHICLLVLPVPLKYN